MGGDEAVVRARAMIGVRFRPQGRSAEQGLDCMGLAAVALDVPAGRVRGDYWLTGSVEEAHAGLLAAGLVRIGQAQAGDLLLVAVSARRLHGLILTGHGFVHADARLRRVVEVPGEAPWPVVSAWRAIRGG
jgi:lipoprotein Spr